MPFTTWEALKQQVLDDIADGSILRKSYTHGDRTRSFRDMKEVIDFLNYIDEQIMNPPTSRRGRAIRGITPC